MGSFRLRTNLFVYLAVLLVAGMVLTDVVVTLAAQHVMLRVEKNKTADVLALVKAITEVTSGSPDQTIANALAKGHGMNRTGGLVHIGLVDDRALHLLWGRGGDPWDVDLQRLGAKAIAQQKDQSEHFGRTWGVFKPEPQALLMAMPLHRDGRVCAALVAACLLDPVYQDLRQVQAILLIYMGINALVLTLAGFWRFHTIMLNPIKRLVQTATQAHSEEAVVFGPVSEKSEFGRLSASLNQMLQRIGQDKERLQAMVTSLEAANRQLQQAHDKILRAEKLAVAGRLSAGIAHEIGNPVSIVMGYLSLLQEEDLAEEERREFLRRTQAEVNRIHDIIARLLDLARPSPEKRQPIGLHQTIASAVELVRDHPLTAGIDLVIDTGAPCDTVMADGDQLHQVLLNLLLNAADAVAARSVPGRIAITTCNPLPCGQDKPQGVLRVAVADNGVGISQDRLAHVFDPFFSTKDPGRGTGLGLSVSLMIIEAHGGTLTAASSPGKGATFTLELPLLNNEAED